MFEDRGYTLNNEINSTVSEWNKYVNGFHKMNRPYYFIASHGDEWGTLFLSPNDTIRPLNIPSLDKVKTAVFAVCFGGAPGLAAQFARDQGADNSLGWLGPIDNQRASTFTNLFWIEHICFNKTAEESMDSALKDFLDIYWYIHLFDLWENDTLKEPKMYKERKILSYSIQTASKNVINIATRSDNTTRYESHELENGRLINLLLINGMPTNVYTIGNSNLENKTNISNMSFNIKGNENLSFDNLVKSNHQGFKNLKGISNFKVLSETSYVIFDNNEYQIVKGYEVSSFENTFLQNVYVNTNTMEIISDQEFSNFFGTLPVPVKKNIRVQYSDTQ